MFYYPINILSHTPSHTYNLEYFFDIVANPFWFTCTSQSTNTQYDTEGVICLGKLCVIYYSPGRDWGDPRQQFLCWYTIYIKASSVQFRIALWLGITLFRESSLVLSLCRCSKITEVTCTFPCFFAGILITKRFRVRQLKNERILAIALLKSTP